MRIYLESQPLCDNSKTGIGWFTYYLFNKLLDNNTEFDYYALVFDFLKRNNNVVKLRQLFKDNEKLKIRACTLFPYRLYLDYNKFTGFIPYNFLTGSKRGIHHFFQFIIPRRINGPVINTVYDMVYKLYPDTMECSNYEKLHRELFRSCKQADVVLTISKSSKKEISELMTVPEEKIKITYPAVDRNIFYPRKDSSYIKSKYGISGEYLLYLGTLEPRKNIPLIIEAFSSISRKNKDITLVIAGKKGWQYEVIFEKTHDLKLDNQICFTGYVDLQDIPALYSGAIAFVFPSLYEGFGMPPLEAMACGTPVIVSNTSSLPEVVGEAGILVNPLDAENIAFEMDRVINSSSVRLEYSKKGIVRSKSFTWEDSAQRVIDIYKSLS